MSYSQFNFQQAVEEFNLIIREGAGLLGEGLEPVEFSNLLKQILEFNIPLALAIATKKARSELIIAPLLVELQKTTGWALFSGVDFNVDLERGLSGYVDFIISCDPEQLYVKAPVAVVIEAKKDDINSGLGQCVATMVAAQIFNQRREQITRIRGAVTTGTAWKLLELQTDELTVDFQEYRELEKVLAFLTASPTALD